MNSIIAGDLILAEAFGNGSAISANSTIIGILRAYYHTYAITNNR